MGSRHPLRVVDLGTRPYREVWELQRMLQKERIEPKLAAAKARRQSGAQTASGAQSASGTASPSAASLPDLPDLLLFVEHPPVYTLGKSGKGANMLITPARLEQIGAEYVEIDRGGDITFHGPGQIVGYPILDLDHHITDIHRYLRQLEEVVIRTCAAFGVTAGRIKGLTGVWVEDRKICAFGVKCSRWVTMHGFALNVSTDLSYFHHIVPCGIPDKMVTSLEQELGAPPDPTQVKREIVKHFLTVFDIGREARPADPWMIETDADTLLAP
jgi:lipoyl(octanoyl) transferase